MPSLSATCLLQSIESSLLKAALTGEGPFGSIFGSAAGASTAANPAGGGIFGMMLKGLRFAEGGEISGPGGPRSDTIPAMVSPGEFIVNAKAAQGNLALLHAINSGKLPAFADGGQVGGGSAPSFSPSAGAPNVNIQHNLTLNAAGGTKEQNADLAKQLSNHVEESTRRIVSQELLKQIRPGNMLDGTKFT